jgi:hypothetical protein
MWSIICSLIIGSGFSGSNFNISGHELLTETRDEHKAFFLIYGSHRALVILLAQGERKCQGEDRIIASYFRIDVREVA